ncbi:MAG TPA: hypothetical protein DCY61_05010 [Dehalococcoidia bacterium]|nr:hypothetical protein [Dehalococcoidia bacterium]
MTDLTLARDNLFQLNILVWASFPQPAGAPVTPVLRDSGYILWSVEQPLEAGTTELANFRRANLQIRPNPVVDVVFHHPESTTYVLVECKPSSFSVASEWAQQARGFIVAGGNVVSRLGLGVHTRAKAEVCYLVPEDDAPSIDLTLVSLAHEVSGHGLASCPTGPLGISIKDDGVYLGLSNQPQGTAQISRVLIPEQKVLATPPNQNPKPLYVIPWIPDVQDEAGPVDFKERLRQHLLVWMGKILIESQNTLLFEDLLDKVSRGVFLYWRDRTSLMGRVFPMIARVIRVLFARDNRVSIDERTVTVNLQLETDREELMEQVRTAGIPQRLPEGVQLRMKE